ncbi:MAG: MarR family winged helix-turn-helix transcriptional regulator [Bacteroidota bacterium]|jgi:DNA-binding MarR family transcriptional regulator
MTKEIQFTQSIRTWMDAFMQRSMGSWWRFARSTGLSMPQFSLMTQMYHRGACGMSGISDRFEITPAAASQMVDKLVQSGYVVREEDPTDRRAKTLNLTAKGRQLIDAGNEERYRWVEDLAGKLNAEERARIVEALEVMTQAMQELEEEPVHG